MELFLNILKEDNSPRFVSIGCPYCTRQQYCEQHDIHRFSMIHINESFSNDIIMMYIAYNCRLHKKLNVIYLIDMTYIDREPYDYLLYLVKPNGFITDSKYLLYIICCDTRNVTKNIFIYVYSTYATIELNYAVYLSVLLADTDINIKDMPNISMFKIRYYDLHSKTYIRVRNKLNLC